MSLCVVAVCICGGMTILNICYCFQFESCLYPVMCEAGGIVCCYVGTGYIHKYI